MNGVEDQVIITEVDGPNEGKNTGNDDNQLDFKIGNSNYYELCNVAQKY